MGNKSSSSPQYPPRGYVPYPFDPRLVPPGMQHPPPGAIDEGWAVHSRQRPVQRPAGWAGSRMSLAGSRVDLAYTVDPVEQMIVLPPDPKMLKKIHKEQKKLLKRMRGLPVEVIVAPVGVAGRLPPPHPNGHFPPRTFSVDNLARDSIYSQSEMASRRPASGPRWGGPNGSIDSPMTSSAGSNTMDGMPSWISEGPPHVRPATNLSRSETDRLEWARRHRVVQHHVERIPRDSRPLSPPIRPPSNGIITRTERVERTTQVGRPRSLWMDDIKKARSATNVHSTGVLQDRKQMDKNRMASNWSSASSERLGGSTGDIDFSWVREEEGRLRNNHAARPREKLPECYFGMESNDGKDKNKPHDNNTTMSMAF